MSKREQFAPKYGRTFDDESVVAAYGTRPPYPDETVDILMGLIAAPSRVVLDAGCGPGTIARMLVDRVERVDAIDPSEAMIRAGQAETTNAKIRWSIATVEEATLDPPYSLIVTAASLHWMHWETVMPKFREALAPGAFMAIVDDIVKAPWLDRLGFIGDYSLNTDFVPYSIGEIVEDLERLGLFEVRGTQETQPVRFMQSLEEYVESFHARNGLSRDRMDREQAAEFDARVRDAVGTADVEMDVSARVIWGWPLGVRAAKLSS